MTDRDARLGVFCALGAYGLWGLLPVYLKAVAAAPPQEVLVHRIVWSVVFTGGLLILGARLGRLRRVLASPPQLAALLLSSALIAVNWLLYIWAVHNDRLLEASLGYYINPLVNVLLGMVFLSERLDRPQTVAVGLAATGIVLELVALGRLPWISLVLAFSFGSYGLVRKRLSVDPQTGLFLETVMLSLPALLYWTLVADSPTSDLRDNPWTLNLLLLAAGPVTAIPLMLFAAAAQRLTYATLGMFQYLAPTTMFVLAVAVYDELIDPRKLVTFVLIWMALIVYSGNAWRLSRARRREAAADA